MALLVALGLAASAQDGAAPKDRSALQKDLMAADYKDRGRAAVGLGKLGNPADVPAVAALLADPHPYARDSALQALERWAGDGVDSWVLGTGLASGDARIRSRACDLVFERKIAGGGDRLAAFAGGPDRGIALAALAALATVPHPPAAEALRKLVPRERDPVRRGALVRAVLAAGGDAAAAELSTSLGSDDGPRRIEALLHLSGADPLRAVAEAEKALQEGDWRVRSAATHVLLDSWRPEAIPVLLAQLGRSRGREARDVALALGRYAGKEMDPDPALWQSWWDANRERFELPARPRGEGIGVRAPVKSEGTRAGPSYYGVLVETRRACFALDLSGSMRYPPPGGAPGNTKGEPSKAQGAAEEVRKTLASLPEDAHVQAVAFSDEVATCFRDGPHRLTAETRAAIANFLAPRVRDPGGYTNLYDGIRAALADDGVDTLYLFTDGTGSVGEYVFTDRLHAKLGQENRVRRVQIHAFTYETRGVVLDAMRRLAEPTWGIVRKLP